MKDWPIRARERIPKTKKKVNHKMQKKIPKNFVGTFVYLIQTLCWNVLRYKLKTMHFPTDSQPHAIFV